MNSVKWAKISGITFLISAVIACVSFYFASRLPSTGARPDVRLIPEQTELTAQEKASFVKQVRGHSYSIKPMFAYHLRGLVVSLNDSMGWLDTMHVDAGDYLNSHDLCVVWADDAEKVNLSEMEFSHGDWTCYYRGRTWAAYRTFRGDQLSNNHLLPASDEIRRLISDVRIGDQIEFSGQLVSYKESNWSGYRVSSTTRDDTGEHACEVEYVTDFRFLKRHHAFLYRLARFTQYTTIIGFIGLLISLFALPFLTKRPLDEISYDLSGAVSGKIETIEERAARRGIKWRG